MGSSKKKGDLLEQLVARLHETDVRTRTKVQVPVLGGGGETREIDVLIEGTVSGYPVRMAVECKNWRKSVGVEVVDAFVGKLQQIGIPPSLGIIVSPSGFTGGALRRAERDQVRLHEFEGLTPDLMGMVVHEALQSVVYVTLTWHSMSTFPFLPRDSDPGGSVVECSRAPGERPEHWALRASWDHWRSGRIPLELGEHEIAVREPVESGPGSELVMATLLVHGQVFSFPGELRVSKLKDARTGAVERMRFDASFGSSDRKVTTRRLQTEAELSEHLEQGVVHVVGARVRVPRLELHGGWFPPSRRALHRFKELLSAGRKPSFEEIEGLDIRTAWDEPADANGFPVPLP